MADDPDIQAAARKNALALKLLTQGRQREALKALNEAIRIAPAYPHTYANRALVFDQMSLPLQAEAEREHARELAPAAGYSEEEIFGPPAPPEPEPKPAQRIPRTAPVALPRREVSSGTLSLIIATAIVIIVMVAGVVVLPGILSGSGDDQATRSGSGPSSTAPGQSPTTAAQPLPAGEGSPFSSESLGNAWRAKGFEVAPGQPFLGFSGFQIAPIDIMLSRSGNSARLAAFVYANPDAPQQDWDLVIGSRPAPKPERSLPSADSIWWNANVVIVVLSSPEDISADALDAFLNLSP